MKRASERIKDHIILIVLAVLSFLITIYARAGVLGATVLFLGLPAIYISWRYPEGIKDSIIFSLATALPTAIIIDNLGVANSQWLVPSSVISYRFLGTTVVEIFIWCILSVYVPLIYYLYMFKREQKGSHQKIFILTGSILIIYLFVKLLAPSLLIFPFAYLWMGIFIIALPIAVSAARKPGIIRPMAKIVPYFFVLSLLFEIAAVILSLWIYPGYYLAWLQLGSIGFPLEELVFWVMLLAPCVVASYELFD